MQPFRCHSPKCMESGRTLAADKPNLGEAPDGEGRKRELLERAESSEKDGRNQSEDEGLLQDLANSNVNAFWQLWQKYQKYLYSICLRQMRGVHEDAQDALSRAMLKAFERLPAHAHKIKNLKPWLARLTHNLCLDILRERQRSGCLESLEQISATDTEEISSTGTPEEAVVQQEMRLYLYYIINDLPPRLRETFILRFMEAMSHQSIAEQLALSIENVRKRIQQAREILQERLENYFSAPDQREQEKFKRHKKETGNSDVLSVIGRGAIVPAAEEVKYLANVISLIRVTLNSGAEMIFHIATDRMPTGHKGRLQSLRKYVQQHPRGWRKRSELAYFLYLAGSWEEAIQQYQECLKKQPRSVMLRLQLGHILRLMQRESSAVQVYEEILSLRCSEATKSHARGLIETCCWRFKAAVKEFAKAASLEPHNASHWHALGSAQMRNNSPEEAVVAFDENLILESNDIVALTYSYEPLIQLGKVEEAQRRVQRVLAIDPKNVIALKRLADYRCRTMLVWGGEGKKTLSLIQKALRLASDIAYVQDSLTLYHFMRGEWEEGITSLREFTERHPNQPCGLYNYARRLFQIGEFRAAAEAMRSSEALFQDKKFTSLASCAVSSCQGMSRICKLHWM